MVLIDKAETTGRNTVFIPVALRRSGACRGKLSVALLHVYSVSPYSSRGRETSRTVWRDGLEVRMTGVLVA